MASRSKGHAHRERDTDSGDSLKPLVVLVLLGTILYGAWSVVNKGPGGTAAPMLDAPRADLATAPPFAPQVEMPPAVAPPTAATAAVLPAAANAMGMPVERPPVTDPSQPRSATGTPPFPEASPTYLHAVSAPPPVADAAVNDPANAAPGVAGGFPPAAIVPPAPTAAPAATIPPPLPPAVVSQPPQAPPSAAFASAWADAHDKLAAGRYAEALAVLSAWHDEPSLGLEESQRLDELLGQLAGTVLYSTLDHLLPPHVVQPADTLESIAAPLAVPWPLLAKINGVPAPYQLVPGESLKVLRGPFDGVVSVSRRRLSLRVGGNYAGSFPVIIGRQVRDRVGSIVPVVASRRDDPAADRPAAASQVAWAGSGPPVISLGEGLSIEGIADPSTVPDDAIPATSLLVADRDLQELADILGAGSRVIVRP